MKRILLTFVLGLAAIAASAQSAVIGGVNFSKFQDIESGSTTGYQIGLAYKQPLLLGLAVQPGIVFASKGGSMNNFKMNYLEVPVQVQLGMDLIALRPYLFAEPFIGYAIGGKVGTNGSKIDMSELESRFEYGFGLGAGLEVLDKVQVSCRYYWNFDDCGLNRFIDYVKEHISDKSSFNGVMISAAIFF